MFFDKAICYDFSRVWIRSERSFYWNDQHPIRWIIDAFIKADKMFATTFSSLCAATRIVTWGQLAVSVSIVGVALRIQTGDSA